jgi:hypothetical protein
MGNIIDLDDLVPEDKKVTFKGRTYVLPGDMPMATYLRISKIAQMQDANATQEELLDSTVDALVELFMWNDRDASADERRRLAETFKGMGVRTIMSLIGKVYPPEDGDDEVDADAVTADPTPPASGTTTTSSPSE